MADQQRVVVTLTGEALETLRTIAAQRGVSLSEVVRQAIGHEKLFADEVRAGNRIVVESRDARERHELMISP